jgi:predicted RecA/RadA family phage recombinase
MLQVHLGKMPVEEAIMQIQSSIDSLPKVANAQQLRLGLQMGADVRTLEIDANGSSSVAGDAQNPDDWIPATGEEVIVRSSPDRLLISSFRLPSA